MDRNNILIVIDMQNDFVDGSLGTKEAEAIVPRVVEKIKEYKEKDRLIIATKDTHQADYLSTQEGRMLPIKHCIYGTKGWDLNEKISEELGNDAYIVMKNTFGSKVLINIIESLNAKGPLNIEMVGLCTDICVISNAILLKTMPHEANITVDSSCCAGVNPELHEAALKVMKSCQINIK